ncbi:hypothetical protein AALP_AA3G003600 [Arabis alpina]|uniref:Uncharacterized protein n=1 Tax=Arabis alpina TaxID=50452 RepID=A0A087H643_ARAAL|nr:hypothetical protein AALP_AA3G003600 [Arabis alpina]
MPPNMRLVIAQVSRSIGYSQQQARNFSSSNPVSSTGSESKRGAFFFITRGLAAVAGYGILGPLLFDAQTAARDKYIKESEEYLDREEKMISSLQKS